MATSVLLKDVSMTTGKSPFWDESTQTLLHVDIECGDVHSWNSVTGEDSVVNLGQLLRPSRIICSPRLKIDYAIFVPFDICNVYYLLIENVMWSAKTTLSALHSWYNFLER